MGNGLRAMAKIGDSFWDAALYRRMVQRWETSARLAATTKLSVLREQSNRARVLRAPLDRLIRTADERLALSAAGAARIPQPHNADWAWRPAFWQTPLDVPGMTALASKSKLGDEITLFHDCEHSEMTLRQVRNTGPEELAAFGLRLDVLRFDGSFLSLVLDLPPPAIASLKRSHILQVNSVLELEKPLEIFVRLNVRHGPNTEQIVREIPMQGDSKSVEFDLAYSGINERRIEKAWIDIIFEGPEMNQVILRDLTMNRRPRAKL